MTQTERVLSALKNHPRGITQIDFLLPHVIDGGSPITRVGARILELRDQGHNVANDGRRDKCVVYKLVLGDGSHGQAGTDAGKTPVAGASDPGEPVALFDPVGLSRPLGAYDDVDEAA